MLISRRFLSLVPVILMATVLPAWADVQLNLITLGGLATQTGGSGASLAIDGNVGTSSQTSNTTNSFWDVELNQKVRMTRIDVVASSGGLTPNGTVLRLFDLRDQTLFQATIGGMTAGSTWTTNLPVPVSGRIVHIALENNQTNDAGFYQVNLAEVRVYGDPSPAYGAGSMGAWGTVWQTSTNGVLTAGLAVDANPSTASETLDVTNSYWLLTFDTNRPIQRLELINASANSARLQNLTVRILDASSNSIASAVVPSVAASGNWVYTPPANTVGRYIKIGLEGTLNGAGNNIVSIAEVNVLSTTNLMAGKPTYMTRDSDTLPPNSNVNDDNYTTVGGTSGVNTHDFYWEANLGQPSALYSVRIVSASGNQPKLTNTTLTVMDAGYNPIYVLNLSNAPTDLYDVLLPAPVFGQYVRLSYEYAQRSGGTGGGANWTIDLKEIQAFGRPTNEVGLLSFTATQTNIVAPASTTLQWQETDLYTLKLYPNVGSVGSNTLVGGNGSLTVTPPVSTEYTLAGGAYSNTFIRQVAIEVNGQKLPAQISEFVADNQSSLSDGDGNASDWIELHNPNNTSLNLTGYYLSDNPAQPAKWAFPNGTTVGPHGYLIVFADGSNTNYDAAGYLHASFNLGSGGTESVILTMSNGLVVVDGITNFPALDTDLAYGRTLDGQWKFLDPTPGMANVASNYDGWLQPVDFDHKRGWYTNTFTLALTNADSLAQIFWSTNGFDPNHLYTGPFTVANTEGVRAVVKRTGYKSPRIKTHTYLFLNDFANQSGLNTTYSQGATYGNRFRQGFTDLPVVSINVAPSTQNWLAYNTDRPERPASVEFFMPDGSNIQQDCGVIHLGGQFGTGTGLYAKKTWQLNFKSQYGPSSLQFPLFNGFDHGITAHAKYKELDIHAGNQDQAAYSGARGFYMSHAFALDTMLDMGDLNPHSRFVMLFTNGVYMGQFCINERLTDGMLAEYFGGPRSDYLTVKGNDNTGTWGFIPGVADGPDRSPYDFVRSNMNSYATIKDRVDVTNNIDYMLMWQWGNAEAEFRAAMPRAAGKGGFKVWLADGDGLLRQQSGVAGQISKNDISNPAQANIVFTWGPGWIFSNLLTEANPDFKTLLADRVYKHFFNNGAMTSAKLQARLDARMAEITNSLVGEMARWSALSGYSPTAWQTDAAYARANLFPVRSDTIVSQMRAAGWYPTFDPPTLSQVGGSVTNGYQLAVTPPSGGGTVYYTLDGSDPRLPGGGTNSNAIAWTPGTTVVSNIVNIPLGSTWRYYNTNTAPPGAWTNRLYDDSAWFTGATPAGYPQPDGVTFATVLGFGSDSNNKWLSYYFRKSFVITNLVGITNMFLGLNRDDGAVIYVNGTELMRDNMPAGVVTNQTLAASTVSGANETAVFPFTVPANLLVVGTNVVAVEVHQDLPNSSDIHFDFSLNRSVTNTPPPLILTLTNATTINFRVWNGSTWSALESASYVLAPIKQPNPGDLVISELHYHPPDNDNYEFVELYNTTSNVLDLTGVQITDGITFVFPNGYQVAPSGFALAVKDLPTFAGRYQSVSSPYYYPSLHPAGPYTGKLSDSGERIAVLASNGVELAEVTYSDSGAWPGRADGSGSSLELRDLTAAAATGTNINSYLAIGEHWRSSSLWGGSPGRFDADPLNIVANELNAHTHVGGDWLELKNQTANPIDVSGLYLSDNYSNVFRYYIPATTIIPGGGFLFLSETNIGFAFSEHGEDIILSQASGTNILRFIDTVNYDAVAREESLGRYTRSDGVVDFTELRSQTPMADNDLPRVGPVVISEIMYHPATNKVEYIEIANISTTNVPLYDPNVLTNTWRLSSALSFTFPTNQSLAPGAVAIICPTNAVEFRAEYGVSTNITIYGPWSGALNNAGDNIKLEHPGDRETNGFLPYYRMDHVRYEPYAPWPTQADSGSNISLERVTIEGYGDDPINWQASATNGSPGSFVGNRVPNISVIGSTTVVEGDVVSLTAQGSDPDQPWQSVVLSAQNVPNGGSFAPTNGAFTWTTVETNGPGVYNVRFIIADNGVHPMTATQVVAVTVLESNQAPVLQAVTNVTFPAKIPFTLNLVATDADLPPNILTYGASGLPAGITVNPANGHISGVAQTPGVYPVTLSVADNGSPALGATNLFTLTISPAFAGSATLTSSNTVNFSFQSLSNETYDVLYTPSLSPQNWQVLRHITNAPGGPINITNLPPGSSEIYLRILWYH